MSWDRKRKGNKVTGYFYESVREPGREHPVKRYWGRGSAGQEKAAEIEARQEQRRSRLRAERQEQQSPAVQLANELGDWIEALATAWLLLAGCREHRGEWRATMNTNEMTAETTKKKRSKGVPYYEKPTFLLSKLKELNLLAAKGSPAALKNLEDLVDGHPWLLDTVQKLAGKTEQAWIARAAGDDLVSRKAFAKEVETFKTDLLGDSPTPIQRLIADHAAVCFLALKHAELLDAASAATEASGATARRVAACQKRFKAAMRWFVTVQSKSSRGMAPRAKLKIFNGGA